MTGDAASWIGPVEDRRLIDLPGLVWRSVAFQPGDAQMLDYCGGRIDLPEDLRGAVPKRRSEFLAGRLCALLALQELGVHGPIERTGRAPVWPSGAVGSISHHAGRAVAVVSRQMPALGLDCEPLMSAETLAEIGHLVMDDAERALRPEGWDAQRFGTVVFSAKEAAYKAISARLADIPDFREAHVLDITGTDLRITLRDSEIYVRHILDAGDCITLAIPD
ncbi:4'-phosphopantetheinyl transferase superfamily protein [Paracoccus caeni]|uniref:Enterobactin synthase component D n=1 Tax=Paracoccus caeni TaxID=657651 RepID=A0A934SDP0_9RHOB|nr:4'-phosphopantetheinyl transferase superfamily protein [Paracoccus caeni]MBK4215967.1 4'-phosphopantetheinyl transferase superfamily protein [Paracoccus caeni]